MTYRTPAHALAESATEVLRSVKGVLQETPAPRTPLLLCCGIRVACLRDELGNKEGMCSNLTMGVCDWDSAALACKDLGHPEVGNLHTTDTTVFRLLLSGLTVLDLWVQ